MKIVSLSLLVCLLFCATAGAQMKKLADVAGFQKRLAQGTATIESIESDFTQVKYLDVFNEKVTSQGKFYFRKKNKICLEYTRPIRYSMVINEKQLIIDSDGKKTVMNLSSNKMMNEMQGVLTASMVGDLTLLSSDYQLEYLEDANYYLVRIKPLSKAVLAYIFEIQVYLDKKDMSVLRLRLLESAVNYTEYTFLNKKYNSLKDDVRFMGAK